MTRATTVYTAGTAGYATFRIPAVVAVPDGTLLAFAEGRRLGPGDSGPIDLVLRRSVDHGATWSALQVVASDPGHTVGNPSPVVDPRSGDVVLLTTRSAGDATEERILRGEVAAADSRRVWMQRSTDGGATWTPARELTASTKRPDWRWYATGPGHALALRQGPHAGRLVVPANHSTSSAGHGGHLLLSDDGGRSWRIGAQDDCLPERHESTGWCVHANETTVAELPDGRIYANTRNQGGLAPVHRAESVSLDGGESFARPFAPAPELVTPVVQCSVLCVDGTLVFAGPSDADARRRLSIRTSGDAGHSWTEEAVLTPGPAAYSDLVDLDRDAGGRIVGVVYENGDKGPYERISFTRLALF